MVTSSRGDQQQERQPELEEPEEEEAEEGGEPDHANLMMKQAMQFMINTFQTLKVCEAHATSEALETQEEEDGEQASALVTTAGISVTLATSATAIGAVPRRNAGKLAR